MTLTTRYSQTILFPDYDDTSSSTGMVDAPDSSEPVETVRDHSDRIKCLHRLGENATSVAKLSTKPAIFQQDLTPKDYAVRSDDLYGDLSPIVENLQYDISFLPDDPQVKAHKLLETVLDVAFYGRSFIAAYNNIPVDLRVASPIDVDSLVRGTLTVQGPMGLHLKLLGSLVGKRANHLLQTINDLSPENQSKAFANVLGFARKLIDKLSACDRDALKRGVAKSKVLQEVASARSDFYKKLEPKARWLERTRIPIPD